MKTTKMQEKLLAGITVAWLAVGVSQAAFFGYTLAPIGPVPPAFATEPLGVSSGAGYVVGFELLPHPYQLIRRGFIWRAPGPLVELAPVGGDPCSVATAVNSKGDAVGYSADYDSSIGIACLWHGGSAIALANLPDYPWSCANDINSSGRVVGKSANEYSPATACLWEAGKVSQVGTGRTPTGRQLTAAYSVNERGQVVGESEDPAPDCQLHAYLWDGHPAHDALDLPEPPDTVNSSAYALNDHGQAVGRAYISPRGNVALFWDQDGSVQEIIPPAGNSDLIPRAINNAGWVVGTSTLGPWIWNKAEGSIMLRELLPGPEAELWVLDGFYAGVMAIDNRGQIAGQGLYKPTGLVTSFVATPAGRGER